MRKCRIIKNFWFNEEENNSLKNLSSYSGKTQAEVIRKLVMGATIKEKPTDDFYIALKQLLELRKEIKTIKEEARYTRQLDAKKVTKTLDQIDELRMKIIEKYLK